MTQMLDRRVRDAAPVSDDQVRAFALDELEVELAAQIVARGTGTPAPSPQRTVRRGRPLVRWGVASLVAAATAILLLNLGGGGRLPASPDSAWAAPAVRVANAVPRFLVGEPGWKVSRADEFSVREGEMTFLSSEGGVDLHWRSGPLNVRDRAASGVELPPVEVEGIRARVFRYRGSVDDFTALWRVGGYALELRSSFTRGAKRLEERQYRRVLKSLRTVSVDAWLGAMPASVVLPAKTREAVDAMLAGIPLPKGFGLDDLRTDTAVRARYQLGARVTGAVTCEWIEQWLDARRSRDGRSQREAVAAMQTARRWPILQEMNADGDYPEVVWQYADAMAGRGVAAAGKPVTIAESYRAALGC